MVTSKREKTTDLSNKPIAGTACQFDFSDRVTLRCLNTKHRDCHPKIIAWEARRLTLLLELLERGELVGHAKTTAEEFKASFH